MAEEDDLIQLAEIADLLEDIEELEELEEMEEEETRISLPEEYGGEQFEVEIDQMLEESDNELTAKGVPMGNQKFTTMDKKE